MNINIAIKQFKNKLSSVKYVGMPPTPEREAIDTIIEEWPEYVSNMELNDLITVETMEKWQDMASIENIRGNLHFNRLYFWLVNRIKKDRI
jgi:hypothetical protein